MSPRRYTLEQYADALRQAAGNRRAAAAILGCPLSTVNSAIYSHPELKALCAPDPRSLGRAQLYHPDQVVRALRQAGGNQRQAARLLGCCRDTLMAYIKRFPEVRAAYQACAPRPKSPDQVAAALRQAGGNKRQAARLLEVSYSTLYNYIERYHAVQDECAALDEARREQRFPPVGAHGRAPKVNHHPERFSPEKVAEALRRAGGVKAHAARMLHCSRDMIDGYIKRHPEVREAWIDARETMVDMAETKLHAAVERGEWRAIRYTLSTLGRERGYGTRPVPLQDPFAGHDDTDEFRRALDLVYGKEDPDAESGLPPDDLEDSLSEKEEGDGQLEFDIPEL